MSAPSRDEVEGELHLLQQVLQQCSTNVLSVLELNIEWPLHCSAIAMDGQRCGNPISKECVVRASEILRCLCAFEAGEIVDQPELVDLAAMLLCTHHHRTKMVKTPNGEVRREGLEQELVRNFKRRLWRHIETQLEQTRAENPVVRVEEDDESPSKMPVSFQRTMVAGRVGGIPNIGDKYDITYPGRGSFVPRYTPKVKQKQSDSQHGATTNGTVVDSGAISTNTTSSLVGEQHAMTGELRQWPVGESAVTDDASIVCANEVTEEALELNNRVGEIAQSDKVRGASVLSSNPGAASQSAGPALGQNNEDQTALRTSFPNPPTENIFIRYGVQNPSAAADERQTIASDPRSEIAPVTPPSPNGSPRRRQVQFSIPAPSPEVYPRERQISNLASARKGSTSRTSVQSWSHRNRNDFVPRVRQLPQPETTLADTTASPVPNAITSSSNNTPGPRVAMPGHWPAADRDSHDEAAGLGRPWWLLAGVGAAGGLVALLARIQTDKQPQ
ncbi:uncharacterized protein AB675_3336 [Cyphellophora attinorum]|uniref:Uncharacterized protein n=1 Tax=Cyphellophora attinorum TaxID=1664694 RepID=A0A0N1HAJ1_9EURO|nr:uncharacterized protein AB675_3336 [Phialophora attinorum]KPI39690.1 hypothetical protein AB675_3336 [Phialophora attinorum]